MSRKDGKVDVERKPKHFWSSLERRMHKNGKFTNDSVNNDISEANDNLFENYHEQKVLKPLLSFLAREQKPVFDQLRFLRTGMSKRIFLMLSSKGFAKYVTAVENIPSGGEICSITSFSSSKTEMR